MVDCEDDSEPIVELSSLWAQAERCRKLASPSRGVATDCFGCSGRRRRGSVRRGPGGGPERGRGQAQSAGEREPPLESGDRVRGLRCPERPVTPVDDGVSHAGCSLSGGLASPTPRGPARMRARAVRIEGGTPEVGTLARCRKNKAFSAKFPEVRYFALGFALYCQRRHGKG